MAQFLCPFLITDERQIPAALLRRYNLGLEAICFAGNDLANMPRIARQIKKVQLLYPGKLQSFHFPTEHADYLKSAAARKKLSNLITVCSRNQIKKIVIHSNYFERLEKFNPTGLTAARKKFIAFFKKIDRLLGENNVMLLVENMPIIGNNGDDFDSIFVFPADFELFKQFRNIKINWDLGHWAFTVKMTERIGNLSPLFKMSETDFFDFKKIIRQIAHCHLSSFKGLTFPLTNSYCEEGIPPGRGDYDPEIIKKALELLASKKPEIVISLEIKERDYYKRENLSETLRWLRANRLI